MIPYACLVRLASTERAYRDDRIFLIVTMVFLQRSEGTGEESRIGQVHYASVSSVEPNSCACNPLHHTLALSARSSVFNTWWAPGPRPYRNVDCQNGYWQSTTRGFLVLLRVHRHRRLQQGSYDAHLIKAASRGRMPDFSRTAIRRSLPLSCRFNLKCNRYEVPVYIPSG